MSTPSDPSDRLNANQFDEEGLPGIDKNYPPDHSWGAEDPSVVNTPDGGVAADDLATRVAREAATENDPETDESSPVLMEPDSGDPAVAGDVVDTESQAVGMIGDDDPDGGLSAEQAAMHIVDEP